MALRSHKTVLVVGGTGFTGQYLLPMLINNGFDVYVASRLSHTNNPSASNEALADIDSIKIDMNSPQACIDDIFIRRTYDFCIVLSSICHAPKIALSIKNYSPRKRLLAVSTTGIFTSLNAPTRQPRIDAEHALKSIRVPCVILRPNMIFGGLGDRNISRLVKFALRWHMVPLVGWNGGVIRPIYVKDLARAIVLVLENNEFPESYKAYNIAGPTALTMRQFVRLISNLYDCFVVVIPCPQVIMRIALKVDFLARMFRLTDEQVLRMSEPKIVDSSDFIFDFNWRPTTYEESLSNIYLELVCSTVPSLSRLST